MSRANSELLSRRDELHAVGAAKIEFAKETVELLKPFLEPAVQEITARFGGRLLGRFRPERLQTTQALIHGEELFFVLAHIESDGALQKFAFSEAGPALEEYKAYSTKVCDYIDLQYGGVKDKIVRAYIDDDDDNVGKIAERVSKDFCAQFLSA